MSEDATLRLQRALEIDDRVINLARVPPPDLAGAEAALRDGADLDAPMPGGDGKTFLIDACERGHVTLVQWLLEHGASPNAQDACGCTPLMHAARSEQIDIARQLIEAGADLDVRDQDGWAAVLTAVMAESFGVAAVLVERGADPNTRDEAGVPILARVVAAGDVGLVDKLLERGADPNARDRDGWAILASVRGNGEEITHLFDLLLERGADPSDVDAEGRSLPAVLADGDPAACERLDAVLAKPLHAARRQRVLERLTPEQGLAWLPKSCVAAAGETRVEGWRRRP